MIKRKDLVDITDKDYKTRCDEYMVCQDCMQTFGGTQGDYFMMLMDDVFSCPNCSSKNIALVRDECKTIIVKQ